MVRLACLFSNRRLNVTAVTAFLSQRLFRSLPSGKLYLLYMFPELIASVLLLLNLDSTVWLPTYHQISIFYTRIERCIFDFYAMLSLQKKTSYIQLFPVHVDIASELCRQKFQTKLCKRCRGQSPGATVERFLRRTRY